MWIELLCHLWSQLHLCGCQWWSLLSFSQQTMLLKKALTTPVDRWHVLFHTKRGSRIFVHVSTTSQKVRTRRSFHWQEVSFSCSCVSQKGRLLSRENGCLKQIVADWTLKSSHWSFLALWTLIPRKHPTWFLYICKTHIYVYWNVAADKWIDYQDYVFWQEYCWMSYIS